MPKYWAVVTVGAGPTLADITIDGTFVPIGPTSTGGMGGHRVIDSDADPVPFIFHARGPKGFPVTLGIVLSPLPSGADIKCNPPAYKIPNSGILAVDDGKIPVNTAAINNIQLIVATPAVVAKRARNTAPQNSALKPKRSVKKGGKEK